ncbi:MAG: TraB/GumN family protein [Bradymonadaceae bacterium]
MDAPESVESDITRVDLGDRTVVLVGTAHISQESVEVVRRVIDLEDPDVVCVELDEERWQALQSDQRWADLDLFEVIREGKLTFLLARLALTAFQKQMGSKTGVTPGAEMAAAAEAARELGVPVELVDRDVRTTLLRAWRRTPWWRRFEVAAMLVMSLFQSTDLDEGDLSDLREEATLNDVLEELGEYFPELKEVLVDERDEYMAHQIDHVDADKIVAIVGAAHREGTAKWLQRAVPASRIDEVTTVPPKSTLSDVWPWLIPAVVVGVFAYGMVTSSPTEVRNAFAAWVVANGALSSLGTLLARGHVLTVLAAFVAAPITSLNPTVGAGMATALVQTWAVPPTVGDFQSIGDDVTDWSGWWSNRLGRVMLVFLFSSFGSALGTFIAFGWLKNLLY